MQQDRAGGTFYIVSTPIGNLGDITYRAVKELQNADVVYAEDTRVTASLFKALGLSMPKLLSCHDHNESARIAEIAGYLDQGRNVALVSDAGTPLICDPGFVIVRQLRQQGYQVVPIPGVSAVITAISASGLNAGGFQFLGFLPAKSSARMRVIESVLSSQLTSIFYESTHRLIDTLGDISKVIPARRIVVAKELTKQFERFFSGTADEILSFLAEDDRLSKGEFVLLIDGVVAKGENKSELDHEKILAVLLSELPVKQAVSLAVKITGAKKNALYEQALKMQSEESC
ncbi:MAG: 16S rRNA (cytidine(1402)-2'-O)-methyltransferase [Francisellaceae bacterium]